MLLIKQLVFFERYGKLFLGDEPLIYDAGTYRSLLALTAGENPTRRSAVIRLTVAVAWTTTRCGGASLACGGVVSQPGTLWPRTTAPTVPRRGHHDRPHRYGRIVESPEPADAARPAGPWNAQHQAHAGIWRPPARSPTWVRTSPSARRQPTPTFSTAAEAARKPTNPTDAAPGQEKHHRHGASEPTAVELLERPAGSYSGFHRKSKSQLLQVGARSPSDRLRPDTSAPNSE